MKSLQLACLLPLLILLGACASSHRFVDAEGREIGFAALVDACADQDVVYFGEAHPNDHCHEQQRRLLAALVERRKDVAITMEMFERDVQDKIDAYLAGDLPEAEFRKQARAWKNWHHYRPLLQIAAAHGLPVFGANPPTTLARKVSRGGGLEAVKGNAHVAAEVQAPKDAYFEKVIKAMTGKPYHATDNNGDAWINLYYAQVLKDETMAETITRFLAEAHKAGRRPLVVHFCGDFHSAQRLGVPPRVDRRLPGLKTLVIETEVLDGGDAGTFGQLASGDVRLFVDRTRKPTGPRKHPPAQPEHKASAQHADPHKPAHPKANPHKPNPHQANPHKPNPHKPAGGATAGNEQRRPGLGFMPAYNAEGVVIGEVIPERPAAKAGLKANDKILKLDGEELEDFRDYMDVLSGLKIGSKVKVLIERGGKELTLDVVVGESRR